MSPCTGHPDHVGCAHQLMQPGIHWPYCIDRANCTGCMPVLPEMPKPPGLDLSLFRKD